MYTMQQGEDGPSHWEILDPDGDWICTVRTQTEAEALISHLNR